MDTEKFNKILDSRLDKTVLTLGTKGEEYSSDKDRLHNFKLAAEIQGNTPEQALYGMLAKHLVSVHDIVIGGAYYTEQIIDEKIGDVINYHILLEALLLERLDEEKETKED